MRFLAEYNVSVFEDGTIVSAENGKSLKYCLDKFGYARVYCRHNSKRRGFYVHRLLAMAQD